MPQRHQSDHLSREVTKQWNRGQKANVSALWPDFLCVLLLTPVDEIPVSYVATHEIDDRPVYDHKTGERLSPHLVKVGRQTEHDAMTRHQLFERVPIARAQGEKVRCQWLDELKEGANGPFVRSRRSRLVVMEVAHGVRFDTFAGTAPLKCIKIIISRAASIKHTRGGHSRALALHDITVAFWHALLPEDEPIVMYPPRGEEEAGYMWQMLRQHLKRPVFRDVKYARIWDTD